jgi:hypothetical protein
MRFGLAATEMCCATLVIAGTSVAEAHATCAAPRHAHVLVRREQVLAWEEIRSLPRTNIHPQVVNPVFAVVACSRPGGRPHTLYRSSPLSFPPVIDHAKAAGAKVAFFTSEGSGYGSEGYLSVFDVRSGRRLFRTRVALSTDYIPSPFSALIEYALDAKGDVAWIEEVGERRIQAGLPPSDYLRLQTAHGTLVLETASSITHVTIEGGRVDWVAEGRTRSAPLGLSA